VKEVLDKFSAYKNVEKANMNNVKKYNNKGSCFYTTKNPAKFDSFSRFIHKSA